MLHISVFILADSLNLNLQLLRCFKNWQRNICSKRGSKVKYIFILVHVHHSSCASRESRWSLTPPGKAWLKRPCLGRIDIFHLPPTRISVTFSLTCLKCYVAIPVASWPSADLCLLLLCSSLAPPAYWNNQFCSFWVSRPVNCIEIFNIFVQKKMTLPLLSSTWSKACRKLDWGHYLDFVVFPSFVPHKDKRRG